MQIKIGVWEDKFRRLKITTLPTLRWFRGSRSQWPRLWSGFTTRKFRWAFNPWSVIVIKWWSSAMWESSWLFLYRCLNTGFQKDTFCFAAVMEGHKITWSWTSFNCWSDYMMTVSLNLTNIKMFTVLYMVIISIHILYFVYTVLHMIKMVGPGYHQNVIPTNVKKCWPLPRPKQE